MILRHPSAGAPKGAKSVALISIKTDGSVPASELQLLESAVRTEALSVLSHLRGVTPQVAIVHPPGGPWPAIIEADFTGQIPDQAMADVANSCFQTTRGSLRHLSAQWIVDFNAPAQVRKLANRSWDEDGHTYRWPEA